MSDHSPSSADPFGLIADEFVEALRQGKRPSVEEFARRYPEHADTIREMLPALVLMEKAKSADVPGALLPSAVETPAGRLQQLGDYQILREVGRGGMGVVYEAQQLSLGRHVALKVLTSYALLDPRQLGRFEREAKAAAKLHHTNIVPVFGVGEQDGVHYYVMQFIQGLGLDQVLVELRRLQQPGEELPLTRDIAPGQAANLTQDVSAVEMACALLSGEFRSAAPDSPLTTAEGGQAAGAVRETPIPARAADSSATIHLPGQTEGATLTGSGRQYWHSVARIGMQVADALAHAASQGVLHRDIKPSNLLLDEQGNIWVTDFGLAKADSDGDNLTHTGDIVGTLRYMAPERFDGQGDLRSDVYSLGLTLYELLALRPAFDEGDRNRLVRQVMHDEPVRPRKLNPAVPPDLETVVLKAIARDSVHRYQTPAELADDLKCFVEDRPIRARRVSEAEKFRRWCRRNPLPASLLAGIVLVFLAGFAGVFWEWREAEGARQDEKNQRKQADALRLGAEKARDEAKRREGEAVAARDEARLTRNAAARQAAVLLLDRGIETARSGEPAQAVHLFVRALRTLPPDDPEAEPLERVIRTNLAAWAETVPALEHVWPRGPIRNVFGADEKTAAFSPDGTLTAFAVADNQLRCFRTDVGRPGGPPAKLPGQVGIMEFAADSRSIWVESRGPPWSRADGFAILRIDAASGRPVQRPIPTTGPLTSLIATADGRYLVGAVNDIHPRDTGPKPTATGMREWRTASIVVWETASGRVVRKVEVNAEQWSMFLGVSSDSRSVTAWGVIRSKVWDGVRFSVDGDERPISLPGPNLAACRLNFSFRGDLRTALVYKDGQIHRWSSTNPGVLGPGVAAPYDLPSGSGLSPDGRFVVSREKHRVFDAGAWPPRPTGVRFAHPGMEANEFSTELFSPDGRFVLTTIAEPGQELRFWRLPRGHSRPPVPAAEVARQGEIQNARGDLVGLAAFDVQRSRVILNRGSFNTDIRLMDVATGAIRGTGIRHGDTVVDSRFSPDGKYFATGSSDGTARVWEAATGRPAGPSLRHTNYVAAVAFSPDGKSLAAGDYGPAGLVVLWDWRTGKRLRELRHDDIVLGVTFSPDGRYLAAVKAPDWSKRPEIWLWDVTSGTAAARLPYKYRHAGGETAVFRPDGRAVLAVDANGVLRMWEVPSGKLLSERALDGCGTICFSPDGRIVAVAVRRGVRLLDAGTLAPVAGGYLPEASALRDLAFSPDGALLLAGREEGSAQLWDLATRKPVGPPAVLIGKVLAVAFSTDGRTCIAVAADGTIRRWPVPVPLAEPDLDRLADRVALMTALRMDENQGMDFVPTEEWRALRARLVGDGSTALVPPRPGADWHDARAADAEQDRDAYGALWHLDRLAVVRPDDWTVAARRGRALLADGRRDEAAAAYLTACCLAPSPRAVADWLRAVAYDDEQAKRTEAARWNLKRAIELMPGD